MLAVLLLQDVPATSPALPADLLSSAQGIAIAIVVGIAALSGIFKATGLFLGFVAAFWPRVMPLAAWFAKTSNELHLVGAKWGSLIPGSVVARAKMEARRMGPPAAALVLVACLGLSQAGCAAFRDLATSNPLVVANAFGQAAEVADQVAEAAFAIAEPLLPAADQPTAQADFAKAQAAFTDAMTALSAGEKAYADGQAQDWPALFHDAEAAVDAVVAAVDVFGAAPAAGLAGSHIRVLSPAFATRRAQLTRAVATVHRYPAAA